MSYLEEVRGDVRDFALEHAERIAEQLLKTGGADKWAQEYNDNWSHEAADVISSFGGPRKWIEVLEELSDYEETDSGLWDGCKTWQDTLTCIAHYTYRNALEFNFQELLELINENASEEGNELFDLLNPKDNEEAASKAVDEVIALAPHNDLPKQIRMLVTEAIAKVNNDEPDADLLMIAADALEEAGRVELSAYLRSVAKRINRENRVLEEVKTIIQMWK